MTSKNKDFRDTWTLVRRALGMASAAGLLSAAGLAHAQDPVTMAPPVQGAYDNDAGDIPDNASQDTVFNWREVPAGQRVTIARAVFDKGGYQLYDDVGETIVVPFSSDNLYVMKFGISDDGSTYFINDGSSPTLYLPHDGYLENATVTGAKWYPFPQDYQPAEPVFLGIAPSWDSYVDMGWYPDMAFYGGYYCREPFISGAVVFPTFGLFINIGGNPYYGWADYHHYSGYHPGYHLTIVNNDFYRWGGHPDFDHRSFGGGVDHYGGDSGHGPGGYGGNHNFGGGNHGDGGDHGFQGGHPTFGNASGDARPFGGGNTDGGYRSFSSHTFQGGQDFGGGRGFGGGHDFGGGQGFGGGRSFGGGQNPGNGGRDFGGSNSSGGNFGGAGRSFGGGSPTFGNFSGNARPSGGNSGDRGFGNFGGTQGGGTPGGFGGGNHSFGGGNVGGGGGRFGGFPTRSSGGGGFGGGGSGEGFGGRTR